MGALLVCGLLNLLWAAAAYGQSMGQEIPLTNNDVEELVNAHNFFRGSVEPPATNMKSLVSVQHVFYVKVVLYNYGRTVMF